MEEFPTFTTIKQRSDARGWLNQQIWDIGMGVETQPIHTTTVEIYVHGMEFVQELSLKLDSLRDEHVERIHLEFYGGAGVIIFPDFENGVLRMANVRRSVTTPYERVEDSPTLFRASAKEHIRIYEFFNENTRIIKLPEWFVRLDSYIFELGEAALIHLQIGIRAYFEEIKQRFIGTLRRKKDRYPEAIKVGDTVKFGRYYPEGFVGMTNPPLREIAIFRRF